MGLAACIPLPLLPGPCLSQAPDSLCQDLCHPFLVCSNKQKYGKLDGRCKGVTICIGHFIAFRLSVKILLKVPKYASSGGVKGGV